MADVRNWKLIHDPFLKKGLQKLVRYDGIVPGNPAYNVHHLSDPRTLVPTRHPWGVVREQLDIPIPQFQIDENYVGSPPPREVSFTDLNDNISPAFLAELCKKCGEYDDLKIYYHPIDKRHLGIGRVVFKKMKYASICVEKHHGTSIMGKTVRVFFDAFGKEIKKMFQDLSSAEPCAGTSVKETPSTKRCQNTASTTAPSSQSSDVPSVTTPHCVATVPEDPMSTQQTSSYSSQVYSNCLPSAMPPFPWPPSQSYWPQGAPWPQTPWPVPYPQTFPPYTQPPQPLESSNNLWSTTMEPQKLPIETSTKETTKQSRKNNDYKQNRERDRSSDTRQKNRDGTPEHKSSYDSKSKSSSTDFKSKKRERGRCDFDRKERCDDIRQSIDKRAQRFVNKMTESSSRRRSEERKGDRKHFSPERDDRKHKRRDNRSSSSRRVRDESVERHRHRSRTPPPKKLGNKLYNWHNRMHSSPIVAKYETLRYGNRNAKESKESEDVRRPVEKVHFDETKKDNHPDMDSRRGTNQQEPIVETYEEEYYRRKKLGPPVENLSYIADKRSGGNDKRDNNTTTSTNFVDEIEEYKFVSRKLCQRVAYPTESDEKLPSSDKVLEAISSTEDDDEEVHYLNTKQFSPTKSPRKNCQLRRHSSSSVSSNNSSVQLEYSSLSENESSAYEPGKGHFKRENSPEYLPSNDVLLLERVSSLEREDLSDVSSGSPATRSRRRNRFRKRRDESKRTVREIIKEKRADSKTLGHRQRLTLEEKNRTGPGTPLIDEPLPNTKNTVNDLKKLNNVRPSSSLEKRIQNILRGDGKFSSEGNSGTPLQDEPVTNEKLTSSSKCDDKNETNDDDDKMSLSSGASRPTSRNGENDSLQKCSVVPAVPTMPMTAYSVYPPGYNPYDPNVYAMMYANMMNYGMPGAQQFAQQMPMWPQQFAPYPQTSFEAVKPNVVSIDIKDPQVLKRLTTKTCSDVVKDLKSVLHKDISKRLIENSAFQLLDSWFAKQDKVNEILKPKNEQNEKETTTISSHLTSTTSVTTSLSRLFVNDNTSGLSGSNSGSDLTRLFGFGLRATLPKLPSFKRKIVKPQPSTSQRRRPDEVKAHRRRKTSRSSSSSSTSSSDKSSDESDEDDRKSQTSQSSVEAIDSKNYEMKECVVDVYSDSDSDNDVDAAKVVRNAKPLQISSEGSDKSSVDDESDNDDNKSSSEKTSNETSSSNDSDNDSSNNESVDTNVVNDKEDETESSSSELKSTNRLDDIKHKKVSFERSFSSQSPPQLGVYADIVREKKTLIEVDKNSKENRHRDEDSFEFMTVDDSDHYCPIVHDHCYFYPNPPVENLPPKQQEPPLTMLKPSPKRGRPSKNANKVAELLKKKRSVAVLEASENVALKIPSSTTISLKKLDLVKPVAPSRPEVLFKSRDALNETKVLFDFLTNGIDDEDGNFMKRAYDEMLTDGTAEQWLLNSHWTPHVSTASVPTKRRRISTEDCHEHKTGCARSEGFYRPSGKLKRTYTSATRQANDDAVLPPSVQVNDQAAKQQAQLSREARSNQRRLLTTLGDADFLKFNQLKYRKKFIRFSRSNIHGWGLFALEDIGQDEMIIEYVGEKVRLNVAEKRERNYEKKGIGSSYLFRIDNDMVIDATKRGAVARFINHSCNPSCYAKIISLDGEKRIVIYSKQLIAKGEEITYDYKFPFEDVKIPCNCGAHNCRGSLN